MGEDMKLADIEATLVHETEGAYLLAPDGDYSKKDWVPKQPVEDNGDGTYTMPEGLAIEKGFV